MVGSVGMCIKSRFNRLAGLGTSGAYPGNTRRDLLRRALAADNLLQPSCVDVPVYMIHADVVQNCEIPVLLPSTILSKIYHEYPDCWNDLLQGPGLREFWSQVDPNDPKLVGHPMLDREDWQSNAVPIVLHGDGVALGGRSSNKSLMTLHFSPLLAAGNTWDTHFLMVGIPKDCLAKRKVHGQDTLDTLCEFIVDDLVALFTGWKDGKPIFDGRKFVVVWIICGDGEFLSLELRLPHFNSVSPCWACGANRSDKNIRDVSLTAAWKGSLICVPRAPSDHVFLCGSLGFTTTIVLEMPCMHWTVMACPAMRLVQFCVTWRWNCP